MPLPLDRCPVLFEGRPTGPRCERSAGHPGDHSAALWWATSSGVSDDAPTAKLPPVRDRILPRPPAPSVRELKGAELLRALADELRDYDDDDDAINRPQCGMALVLPWGNLYCERLEDHPGLHACGQRGTDTWREW